jgi:hypothetical protein
MLVAVILLLISMPPNTSKQQNIPLSDRLNRVKLGNGVILTSDLLENNDGSIWVIEFLWLL